DRHRVVAAEDEDSRNITDKVIQETNERAEADESRRMRRPCEEAAHRQAIRVAVKDARGAKWNANDCRADGEREHDDGVATRPRFRHWPLRVSRRIRSSGGTLRRS